MTLGGVERMRWRARERRRERLSEDIGVVGESRVFKYVHHISYNSAQPASPPPPVIAPSTNTIAPAPSLTPSPR